MLANQHFVGNASLHRKCARSSPSAARCQAFPPAASMHYPPTTGYEMVAPKLRSDKLNQQWRQQHFQATSSAEQVTSGSGRSKVLELLEDGQNTYTNSPEMKAAVAEMEAQNPTPRPAQPVNSGAMHGTWKVFHAPHIANMSRYLLNTKFEPIIYRLGPDNSIISNVKFSSPLGTGWLSAAGKLHCFYDTSVEIRFDRFWVDFGEGLREDVLPEGSQEGSGYLATTIDQVVGSIGRAAFFPQFAVFPIHYLDDDMTVFEFTPLSSKISAQRVGSF